MKRYNMGSSCLDCSVWDYEATDGEWAKMKDIREIKHELKEWLYNTNLTLDEDRKFREILNKI